MLRARAAGISGVPAVRGPTAHRFCYRWRMCHSIKTLRNADPPATEQEIAAAALQFVRKVSGYRRPSQRNAVPFDATVAEISESTSRLLAALQAPAPSPSSPH